MQLSEQDEKSAELFDLLAEHRDISDFLSRLARVSAQHLSTHQEILCGITQRRENKNLVVGSSSPAAQSMDEVQAGYDEGPCLQAQQSGVTIRVADVRYEKRWPDYMAAVRDSGLRSVLAVPLTLNGLGVAAMNLYTTSPGAFDEHEVETAQEYARLASRVMMVALRIAAYADHANDRRAAMESRTAIDLAVGIVMGQNRCSQDEAMTILKRASSQRNIKVRVMADQLVRSVGQSAPKTSFTTSS